MEYPLKIQVKKNFNFSYLLIGIKDPKYKFFSKKKIFEVKFTIILIIDVLSFKINILFRFPKIGFIRYFDLIYLVNTLLNIFVE